MRFLIVILISLTALSSVQSQDSNGLNSLPECAVKCFSSAFPNSNCSITDTKCICADTSLETQISRCVETTCTVKEALTAHNASSTSCDAPIRDLGRDFINITIVCATVSGLAVALRVFYRTWINASLGLDDLFIVGILLVNFVICLINVFGLSGKGLGRDVWTVPFNQITDVTYYSYLVTIFYFAIIPLIKISILLFYLRLFPSETIRRIIYLTILFNILFLMTYVSLGIFQCSPISFFWVNWDGEHKGKCMDTFIIVNSYSGISILVDIWMLILPMTQIWNLNLELRKKVAAGIMFSLGVVFTAVSAVRLVVLFPVQYTTTPNPTIDYFIPGYWSQIEITVGIICACLPSIRLLVVSSISGASKPEPVSKSSKGNQSEKSGRSRQEWWDVKSEIVPPDYDDLDDYMNHPARRHDSFVYSIQKSMDEIIYHYNGDNSRK